MGGSEEAQRIGVVADQQVLGLLHHLVRLAVDAGLLVAAERDLRRLQVHPGNLECLVDRTFSLSDNPDERPTERSPLAGYLETADHAIEFNRQCSQRTTGRIGLLRSGGVLQ